jgi:hypothetical protein
MTEEKQQGKLYTEFEDRIKGYPERRLREQPKEGNIGVTGIRVEHDMKGLLAVVLAEAKAEMPLKFYSIEPQKNQKMIIDGEETVFSEGLRIEFDVPSPKQLVAFFEWYIKWFGVVEASNSNAVTVQQHKNLNSESDTKQDGDN